MIFLAAVSLASICALLYLLVRANQQISELLNRIQAPEVVIQRHAIEQNEPLALEVPDMGPWAQPEDDDE
jgi:hypothetical protein